MGNQVPADAGFAASRSLGFFRLLLVVLLQKDESQFNFDKQPATIMHAGEDCFD